jgi:hypothetical protein
MHLMPNTPDDHFRGLPQVHFSTKTIEGEAGLYPHRVAVQGDSEAGHNASAMKGAIVKCPLLRVIPLLIFEIRRCEHLPVEVT